MSYQQLKESLAGVAVTLATPFTDDRMEVRYDELRTNARYLVDAGIPTLIPCGNTGEYYSLSFNERRRIVEETVASVDSDAAVVPGAGGSTKEVVELVSQYESAGADGVMIMHPNHTYIHRKGLREYYETIAANTDLGVVLYKRGPELTDELLVELSDVKNIVGVKYAVNDVNAFSGTLEVASGDVVWSNGIAERFALSFAIEGADGFTSGIGAFVPELPLALDEAIRDGEWDRARRLRELARPYEDLRESSGPDNPFTAANNVPAIKHGLGLAGLYGGPVREPLTALSEEDKRRAEEYYEEICDRLSTLTSSALQ
jgi:4-hydroxy-tetrahydrodipicolinate synthase